MHRAASLSLALALSLALSACTPPSPTVPACGALGVAVEAASAPDRRLLGVASDYPADGMLAAHRAELRTSQRARRAAAWEVIARVVAPVAPAATLPAGATTVPRFRTWYDSDDLARIFGHAYEALGPAGRAARGPLDATALDAAFDWNLHILDGDPAWTPAAWSDYVAGLTDPLAVGAVGGIRRIAMSPVAARHVAQSYAQIFRCQREGAPPAFVDGPPEATARVAREALALPRCGARTFGPYYVASGARLEAHVEGTGAHEASMRVLAGETIVGAEERCIEAGDAGCTASGPGPFVVEVVAGGVEVTGALDVSYTAPDVAIAGCLDGPFPLGAATVAEEWRRVELGPLPTYDTSAEALAAHLAGDATWGDGDGMADPGADEIYTVRVPSGGTFRLAGMHIRTRELDHWVNITMWWSPTPDETFGADRPPTLTGPWAHYAMCVAVEDVEEDPDPTGGFAADAPTLAAALEAVTEAPLPNGAVASWCSNPYIDAAPGLARGNCVGCHQHAMSGPRPGEIVMDEARFPAGGRLFVRNNFPADQFWGLDAGDDLAVMISSTVDYWDAATP